MKIESSQEIFQNTQTSNFIKIRPVGAEFFHEDGRTGRQDEANSRFFFLILRMPLKHSGKNLTSIECREIDHLRNYQFLEEISSPRRQYNKHVVPSHAIRDCERRLKCSVDRLVAVRPQHITTVYRFLRSLQSKMGRIMFQILHQNSPQRV